MTVRRVLVVTSVHPPDDPRIRQRTVGVLAREMAVRYATRLPGPQDTGDHEWVPLHGTRAARGRAALAQMLRRDVSLISVHDPELLPAALLARAARRVRVVFDVHEDVPARVLMRDGLPGPARVWAARGLRRMLRAAERHVAITLAEPGYAPIFAGHHPVFPNYPLRGSLPPPADDAGYVVYVGDVTAQRGAFTLVRAVAQMRRRRPLVLVGRCALPLAAALYALAEERGVWLQVRGWQPHPVALGIAAAASVATAPLLDLPNYRRSLPTKVVEYLGVGVPVVASDLPGTAMVAGGLPGVRLVPPGDPQALARALDAACEPRVRVAARANAAAVQATFVCPEADIRAFYRGLLARSA